METSEKLKKNARQILTEYLLKKGMRKTPERFSILDYIYGYKGAFDIETLYNAMSTEFSLMAVLKNRERTSFAECSTSSRTR